ncbi:molecular chaperone DnaJ [Corynebacterium pelargi]|uniref:Chaperone protein DnaJ n=1 Tax=Corynebacterium pelargi TaxID=1471400 RepID=A0A410W6H1_9CORY|nr:molecular chaperone DnaJ [Corynebacterium pelargi]QAU51552.1 Chaperone protein DnaJ [Corynebacterium pelargi]GGG82310.1 chaperone protein DnaJ 2 [Corynebacterium pelargi]
MAAKNEWAEKDYYADLGVSSSASEQDIKKAYRKLARENHPDSHPGDQAAEERFKQVAEAYDVVGDPEKRKEYDEFKKAFASGGFRGFGKKAGSGYAGGFQEGFDLGDIFGQRGGFAQEDGLGDIFGSFFNRGGAARKPNRSARGSDVQTEITLDFREAAKGTAMPIQLTAEAPCETCHGSGSKSGNVTTCSHCGGSGFVSEQKGAFGMSAPCPYCGGTGEKIEDPCTDCGGTGTKTRTRTITVRIPAGVTDGQKVRLAGQGEAGRNGRPSGDLYVTVHVNKDRIFQRSGDNLEITVPVSFAELTLGDTISVPTLEQPVRVKIPAGTPNGRTLRVRGRGIQRKGAKAGDLLVKVEVKVPKDLDAASTSALRAYAQAERDSGFNPRKDWS